jgi:hypothetical protein
MTVTLEATPRATFYEDDDAPMAHLKCTDVPGRSMCGVPMRTPLVAAPAAVPRCHDCAYLDARGH